MIQPIVAIVEAMVLAGGIAVSRGIDNSASRRRAAAPRPVRVVHRTSENAVQKLIVALDGEKARRAAAEAEVTRLREELAAAKEVIDILV